MSSVGLLVVFYYSVCWMLINISLVPEKPVYVKDDFFDSLSCNTIDNGGRNGRVKFSEQRKIDTEVLTETLNLCLSISP